MKRFAIFVLLGPSLATVILFLVLLPIAGLLEGQRVQISVSPSVFPYCLFPALVLAVRLGHADNRIALQADRRRHRRMDTGVPR